MDNLVLAHFDPTDSCKYWGDKNTGSFNLRGQYRHDQSQLSTGHGISVLV